MEPEMKKITALLFAISFAFVSCASLQKDISIQAEDTQDESFFAQIEENLAYADSARYCGESTEKLEKRKIRIFKLADEQLKTPVLDKVAEARLYAIKGRAALIARDTESAKKYFEKAKEKSEADIQLQVLSRRFGMTSISNDITDDENAHKILVLEAAIENYEKNEYSVSCGLFDRAFMSLSPFYAKAYAPLRENAWKLKDEEIKDSDTKALLVAREITISQMMELTQNSNVQIFKYTGDKQLSAKNLFKTFVNQGLLDCASAEVDVQKERKTIKPTDIATRKICSRFLWNLYTDQNEKIKKTKYSENYRNRENARSPIEDVEISDKDFDAIMGSVENELIDLVDGKNFRGDSSMSAIDFNKSLKKLTK